MLVLVLGLEEFLRVNLKIIFKTAHCTIVETVHQVPVRLCCLLLNELLPKRNKPYDTNYILVHVSSVGRNEYFLFTEEKFMMYFKISQLWL